REALSGMYQSPSRPAAELGDLVRNASGHKGPWPKLSVWHGSADRTVNPANADEIVKQWLDVHQLPSAPMSEAEVDGYPRQLWWNADGETVVESYTITNMAHGTPLGIGDNDERYGAQGAFLIEAGISSSYHIANFFGLTEWVHLAAKDASREKSKEKSRGISKETAKQTTRETTRETTRTTVKTLPPEGAPGLTRALWPLATPGRRPEPDPPAPPKRAGIDVTAVITRALTAAGLMK
ncbi:PHB depolymerase family esterase, partial [Bradyrhizobium sp.]|uniref:alpha/beta hydrolase family esterase n=1 Tax=Bradyrhizobium sp. TaxID=376 RepID=UPI002754855F|nr:poly(3-hydroxybutyrate) depolymerase [Bradyrhizobium sp.]